MIDGVIELTDRMIKFKVQVRDVKLTLECLKPMIQEISEYNKVLKNQPLEEELARTAGLEIANRRGCKSGSKVFQGWCLEFVQEVQVPQPTLSTGSIASNTVAFARSSENKGSQGNLGNGDGGHAPLLDLASSSSTVSTRSTIIVDGLNLTFEVSNGSVVVDSDDHEATDEAIADVGDIAVAGVSRFRKIADEDEFRERDKLETRD
ncbi:hypothetical protein ACLB2K_046970 [Fragaria x ananassa]